MSEMPRAPILAYMALHAATKACEPAGTGLPVQGATPGEMSHWSISYQAYEIDMTFGTLLSAAAITAVPNSYCQSASVQYHLDAWGAMATTYCSSSADSAPAPGTKAPTVWFFGMVQDGMPTFLAKVSSSVWMMAGLRERARETAKRRNG